MSRAARLLLAIGLASMATTVLVVALIAPLWLLGVSVGLAGMLWAEALLFGGLIAADCLMAGFSAAFVRGGCSAVVVTCAALSFALSAGFMLMPGMPLGLFVAFQLLIAFVLVVGCAVLAFFGRRAREGDAAAAERVAHGAGQVAALEEAAASCGDLRGRRRLAGLADALRFVDWGVGVPVDADVDTAVGALSRAAVGGDAPAVAREAALLEELLKKRAAQSAAARRGGV